MILVIGCQRSGTTMLARLLGLSPAVRGYGEGDPKYFREDGTRQLRPLEHVASLLAKERNPFTLLKPLCDSQRTAELLDRFSRAKAVWIVRDYRDCVASHLTYYRPYHDGVSYVQDVLSSANPCWKNDRLSPEMQQFLGQFAGQPINEATAYALYWLARNSHALGIANHDRVRLVRYERILKHPCRVAESLFDFVGVPFARSYTSIVGGPASGGLDLEIDAQVTDACDDLYGRLTAVCREE